MRALPLLLLLAGCGFFVPAPVVDSEAGVDPDPFDLAPGHGGTCDVETDCGGVTPVCEEGGACVQCTIDADCGDRLCVNGLCAECGEDADCPEADPICSPRGRCEPECDGACGDGDICHPDLSICVECVTAADCGDPGDVCTPELRCDECAGDGDCLADEVCVRGNCEECVQNTDCGADQICSASLNCIAPQCDVDGECTDVQDPFCVRSECVECRDDGDCPAGDTCRQDGQCD
jgi:hypothetical protein